MKVTVCDECDERIPDAKKMLEPQSDSPKPPYSVMLDVRVIDGATKTSVDLCWACFDRMRTYNAPTPQSMVDV